MPSSKFHKVTNKTLAVIQWDHSILDTFHEYLTVAVQLPRRFKLLNVNLPWKLGL